MLLLFSHSVVPDSLQSHGLQHARLPCPALSPWVCSNWCSLSRWCHPIISFSVASFSCQHQGLNLCQHQGLFQWVSSLHQVAKILVLQFQLQSFQWIFGLISFRIDWFDLFAVQGPLKSLLQHHSLKASILCYSAIFIVLLTSVHDCWKNHSFDYIDLCLQSDVCAF